MTHPYSPHKFAKVTARFSTFDHDGPGYVDRTLYIQISKSEDDQISGWVVNKNGSYVETRIDGGGYSREFVILGETDILKYEPMRLNLHYCELEKA